MDPTRARPVPFCFQSFLPAPETWLAVLGGGSSLTKGGAVVLHRLPEQSIIDLSRENVVGEFELTNLLSAGLTTLMFAIFLSLRARHRCGGPYFVRLRLVCSAQRLELQKQSKRLCLFSLLLLRCSLLRSLQRVLGCGTGEATTLARRRLGLGDEHEAITRSRDCSFNRRRLSSRSMPRIRRLRTVT